MVVRIGPKDTVPEMVLHVCRNVPGPHSNVDF